MKGRLRFLIFGTSELFVLFAASFLMLSACGGGGASNIPGSSSGNNNTTVIPSQTGSVSAVFAANSIDQMMFIQSSNGNSAGNTKSFVQVAGALTSLDKYALSGTSAVTQDIAGDANFALGRWVWGTVTDTSSNNTVVQTMDGSMANAAWHYILLNKLSTLPTSGVMVCDNGTFTHPTYNDGTNHTNSAVTSGSKASLSFSASGASYSFTLSTTLGTTTHILNFSNTNVGLGLVMIGNGFGAGVAGGYGFLSDGGNGTIRISGIYSNENYQNIGASYYGTYSFLCQ